MMIGTVVRVMVVMSSTEAHGLFGSFLPQVDLYLTGDLRVKPYLTGSVASCGRLPSSVAFILATPGAGRPLQSHAAAGVSFASSAK